MNVKKKIKLQAKMKKSFIYIIHNKMPFYCVFFKTKEKQKTKQGK